MQLRFEATVAGVVPAIRVMNETLAAAYIERVHGSSTAPPTSSPTEMARTGESYPEALRQAQELAGAEADPSEDVSGKDAAAKMAILARLAFNAPVHLDQVLFEGIERVTVEDIEYAKDLGLALKLIGLAERIDGGIAVHVYPAFLYADHLLASVNGAFNAVTVESPAITEITLSGPGAGGPQTAPRCWVTWISAMIPPPSLPPPLWSSRSSPTWSSPSISTSRWRIRLECSRRWPRSSACRAYRSSRSSRRARGRRPAGDGHASSTGVQIQGGGRPDLAARLRPLRSQRDPRDRGGVRGACVMGLWRYRDRLSVEPLRGEGHAARAGEELSERTGCEVWLKLEGCNPTGSFKDRGMTVAVSAAVSEGAEAVVCASTGNTAASAAAYAARAGLRGAVIVPEGKIATGKLAQASMHGARVIALRGNFDQALELVRELVDKHPMALVNSINDFRMEGQKTGAFEVSDELGGAPDVLCIPVGNAGNVTAWWRGFQEIGTAPRLHGYQSEAAPLVYGAPVEQPETIASAIRIGNPACWEDAMNAITTSRGEIRAVSDAEILDAYALLGASEGVFCEPASAAAVAGLLKYGGAEGRWSVLTGHGLKDPQTAMNRAAPVVPCEPGSQRSRGGAGVRQRHGRRARVLGQPRPRLRRAGGGAVALARAPGRGDRRVLRPLRCARRSQRPFQPLRAGVRGAALGRRDRLPDPLGDPARSARRARRRSWPACAPPTTCTSSTRRSSTWPRARGAPGQRGRRDPRRLRDLRRVERTRTCRPASRRWWRSRPIRRPRRRAR